MGDIFLKLSWYSIYKAIFSNYVLKISPFRALWYNLNRFSQALQEGRYTYTYLYSNENVVWQMYRTG